MTAAHDIELPLITWDNLLPPFTDYQYFDGAQDFPFDYEAQKFSLVNAWWLAEVAALVYADEEFVRPRLAQVGFGTLVRFSGSSTDCFVASNDDAALVVFRGTELRPREGNGGVRPVIADIATDINMRLVSSANRGRVHSGFQIALDEIWHDLEACLQGFRQNNCPLWVSGHSLGAALATLTVDRFPDVRALYTFGSPRVGDREFTENLSTQAYRFVFGNDIITRLPPGGDYNHVGEIHLIGETDRNHHRPVAEGSADAKSQFDLSQIRRFFDQLGAEISRMVPDGIRHHVPILYSAQLRRNLENIPGEV